MYKLLLISKYLRKRRIAWVSLLAVCLCTAMVLVVLSVMGGWLRMFRENFRGLSGAVIVQNSNYRGFPYYEEMIEKIRALDGVEAAVPSIQSPGLLNLMSGQKVQPVQVVGVDVDQVARINRFPQSLWRQYQEPLEKAEDPKISAAERAALLAQAAKTATRPSFELNLPAAAYVGALPTAVGGADKYDGMIAGAGVLNIYRNEKGEWVNRNDENYLVYGKLSVLPISNRGEIDKNEGPTAHNYWIVDSSRLKVWQIDDNAVYVPLAKLQKDLRMTAVEDEPARVTQIDVATKPGVNLDEMSKQVQNVVDSVMRAHGGARQGSSWPSARTWEQTQAKYLAAIEQQVVLTTTLFSFISIVAVFLIFCIFYMIVKEKTKDIGIIKSVGATSSGVAAIFLGYGCAIGLLGGALGELVGYLIVHNINGIHDLMGRVMGVKIWNPETYIFDTIPNTIDPKAAIIIFLVAILSSVIGAVIPAYRAGRLNPVEALRFE